MNLSRVTIPVPSRRALLELVAPRPYRELRHRRHAGKGAPWATRELWHAAPAGALVALSSLSAAGWLSALVAAVAAVYGARYGLVWWWRMQSDTAHQGHMLRRLRAAGYPVRFIGQVWP